jgi:transcriptional regulator with XRE-family HTH domain
LPPSGTIPVMGNNLKKLRADKNWTQDKAAEELGVSRGQYIKLERGERRLTDHYIHEAARAFEVPEVQVIGEERPVPLVGYVGAGSEAHFYEDGQGPFDEISPIEDATENTVAVEIRGGSLGPLFEGWRAFYDDVRRPPTDDMLGELCVVALADGRVLVKKLLLGRAKNHFDLWSNYEPPIHDVALLWAAKVRGIRPK